MRPMKLKDIYRVERTEDGYNVIRVERWCDSRGDVTRVNRSVVSRHALEQSAREDAEYANR